MKLEGNKYNYKDLSLSDIESIIKDLSFTPKHDERAFVMYTGATGMFMFDLTMQGIKYSYVRFKKLPGVLYINIGRKEEANKIRINMHDKIYSPYKGTVKLGDYRTMDDAVKRLKL